MKYFAMAGACITLGIALSLPVATGGSAQLLVSQVRGRRLHKWIPAQIGKPQDERPHEHLSPDGMYTAQTTVGDAEAVGLKVFRVGRSQQPGAIHAMLSVEAVDGYMWLPHHSHTLAVAASAIYGTALLAQWCGGRHLHSLVKVRHPDDELFELLGVSPDGRTAFYRHVSTPDSRGWDRRFKPVHRVTITPCKER